jgi:two-component system, sensor histidine kinase and response regulator
MIANTKQDERDRCLQAGMDDRLSKPVNRESRERVLTRWLPRSGAE